MNPSMNPSMNSSQNHIINPSMKSSTKPIKKLTTALDGFKFALTKDDSLLVLILLQSIAVCIDDKLIVYAFIALFVELLNTSIELICDFIHPEYSEKIRDIKDVAAAASFFAQIIPLIIIIRKLLKKYAQKNKNLPNQPIGANAVKEVVNTITEKK